MEENEDYGGGSRKNVKRSSRGTKRDRLSTTTTTMTTTTTTDTPTCTPISTALAIVGTSSSSSRRSRTTSHVACTLHYWHVFFELLRKCKTTIESLKLCRRHKCLCRPVVVESKVLLLPDLRAKISQLVALNEQCARSLTTILKDLQPSRSICLDVSETTLLPSQTGVEQWRPPAVSSAAADPLHVYIIFRFNDLTTIGDHFTCSKRRTMTVNSYNDIEANIVLFRLSIIGNSVDDDVEDQYDGSTTATSTSTTTTSTCTYDASNFVCGHNRSVPHYLMRGWYVARRLKSGFAQFMREKRKFWRSLTYLCHYEYAENDVAFASIVCTHLARMYSNFCFNVHGNVIHASTVSLESARRFSRPGTEYGDFLDDQTVLRVCEHVLNHINAARTATTDQPSNQKI